MTKKDYELIARVLKVCKPSETEQEMSTAEAKWRHLVSELGFALQRENPRFDRQKFFKASELE